MSSYTGRQVTLKEDLGKKCYRFQFDQRHAAKQKLKRQKKRRATKLQAIVQSKSDVNASQEQQNQFMHQELTNEDNQRIQDPNLETAFREFDDLIILNEV